MAVAVFRFIALMERSDSYKKWERGELSLHLILQGHKN